VVGDLLFLFVSFLFAVWVVFFGGASRLEGTIKSGFLVHPSALNWSAAGIRLFVGLGWVGSVILWLLVTPSGCELLPDAEFAALETSLAVSIAEAKRNPSGHSADFRLVLTNRGHTTAKACLGPDRFVSYKAGSSGGIWGTAVDHSGCASEFTIQPGDAISWDEAREVPHLSQGRVTVQVIVQITNPRRCGSWGNCATFDLKSDHYEIP
jgi:hypothetical protein